MTVAVRTSGQYHSAPLCTCSMDLSAGHGRHNTNPSELSSSVLHGIFHTV